MPGQHAIIHGHRGVGKTSLANVSTAKIANRAESRTLVVRVTCNSDDVFDSVWQRAFSQIPLSAGSLGFAADAAQTEMSYAHILPAEYGQMITPDVVQLQLKAASAARHIIVVIDEFEQIEETSEQKRFSNAVKGLSDNGVDATIILVGVADNVGDLLQGHQSVERALRQISMPEMSRGELLEIVQNGLERAEMMAVESADEEIAKIAQGLPHYAHSLSLEAALAALSDRRSSVCKIDVTAALAPTVNSSLESIKTSYHAATLSNQPANLYKHVLLAAAMTKPDELNYFAATDLIAAISIVLKKTVTINAFLQHLSAFTQKDHGPMFEQMGSEKRNRYRFINPMMRPYIIARGLQDGLITDEELLNFEK
jgi:Cdc6-like AAA superfamily ATPase